MRNNRDRHFVLGLLLSLLVLTTTGGTFYALQEDAPKATPIGIGLIVAVLTLGIKEVANCMNLE